MAIDYHTFTADGELPDNFLHQGRFSQITLGEVNAMDFGGGEIWLQKDTLNDSKHIVRIVTEDEFQIMQDRTLRVEMPPQSKLYISLVGAISPNLYVEHRQQHDDRK